MPTLLDTPLLHQEIWGNEHSRSGGAKKNTDRISSKIGLGSCGKQSPRQQPRSHVQWIFSERKTGHGILTRLIRRKTLWFNTSGQTTLNPAYGVLGRMLQTMRLFLRPISIVKTENAPFPRKNVKLILCRSLLSYLKQRAWEPIVLIKNGTSLSSFSFGPLRQLLLRWVQVIRSPTANLISSIKDNTCTREDTRDEQLVVDQMKRLVDADALHDRKLKEKYEEMLSANDPLAIMIAKCGQFWNANGRMTIYSGNVPELTIMQLF